MVRSASNTLGGRLILALIALTLFWAPLSHASQCDHRAEMAGATVSEVEAALSGEAGDPPDAGHVCSCIGCHFHILVQSGPRPAVAEADGQPWPDLAAQSAPASQSDLFRPPRV